MVHIRAGEDGAELSDDISRCGTVDRSLLREKFMRYVIGLCGRLLMKNSTFAAGQADARESESLYLSLSTRACGKASILFVEARGRFLLDIPLCRPIFVRCGMQIFLLDFLFCLSCCDESFFSFSPVRVWVLAWGDKINEREKRTLVASICGRV